MRPFLCHMTDDLRGSSKWKIHLTMKVKVMSSKDSDQKPLIHTNYNKEIICIKKILIQMKLLKNIFIKKFALIFGYQWGLEELMKVKYFMFMLMYCSKNRSRIEIVDRCYVDIGRENDQRENVSCNSSLCKSLWNKQKIIISYILGCKQSI